MLALDLFLAGIVVFLMVVTLYYYRKIEELRELNVERYERIFTDLLSRYKIEREREMLLNAAIEEADVEIDEDDVTDATKERIEDHVEAVGERYQSLLNDLTKEGD